VTYTAAVVGASGYAGGELVRLLLGHPLFEVGPLAAHTRAGQRLGDVHPQLASLADRELIAADADALVGADVIFIALPHGQSASLVSHLPATVPVIDLGADFRLTDAHAWGTYYGGNHAGSWLYGLPELPGVREQLADATRVANPGCYPTAVILGVAPLIEAGLVETQPLIVVAASGTSGAGRNPSDTLLASSVMGSMSAYKVGGMHQHTPEMEQVLTSAAGEDVRVSFTPLLAPMARGILATTSAALTPSVEPEALRECLHAAYDREKFIHVLPEGQWPQTSSTYGANSVHIQLAVDKHTGRVIVVTALDNLVKGAAGQALQNANIMLGIDEDSGLSNCGVAP
jgi:N-acetyl-gamma-glutamyl-phosphate reductase